MDTNTRHKQKTGYTIVEISTVVVIIGILIGGLGVYQRIIKTSAAMAVVNEFGQFKIAINSFYNIYNGLPGDIPNASTLWPSCDGTPANCNGNNNGVINTSATLLTDEAARMWQQLFAAGLVSYKYTGVHVAASDCIMGTNCPASKYSPNGWSIYSTILYTTATASVGLYLAGYVSNTATATISNYDAVFIDSKIDDGVPKSGKVLSEWSDDAAGNAGTGVAAGTGCVTGASNVYNFTSTAGKCAMQFLIQTQ